MTTPRVTEITSARTLTFPLGRGRAITVPCAGPYITEIPAREDAPYGDIQISFPTHGYRERAAGIRAMDSHRCAAHGDLAIYCGCRS